MLRVTEVSQPKERSELGVPTKGLAQTAGVAEARSDRLSVEELAPQTVSRPALALSRGLLGVSEAVADIAGAKQSGGAPHIGAWGGSASQTNNRKLPTTFCLRRQMKRVPRAKNRAFISPLWVKET